MPIQKPKRILVAPLDWGLGHTTRCIPLVRHLQSMGHTVVMAGNEWQLNFINRSLPGIETLYLEGYNVRYTGKAWTFKYNMVAQIPQILNAIKKEQDWLLDHATRHHFDGIISDNRYGLFHPRIHSVIMTHQLYIQSGMGSLTNNMLGNMHYKMLGRFNECWVVDVPAYPNLSGNLGHPLSPPKHTNYIGLLSQFEGQATTGNEEHLLILLSGPEPQRSMLAKALWAQALQHRGNVVFVEGTENAHVPVSIPPHIHYHKQLTQEDLLPLIQNAQIVICRSGYSSLMDMIALHKKAIIIPTPGQTEQLYLAKHLHNQGIFYTATQQHFNLARALSEAAAFPFKKLSHEDTHSVYKAVLDDWINSL